MGTGGLHMDLHFVGIGAGISGLLSVHSLTRGDASTAVRMQKIMSGGR
jgi:hypothetical protein